MNAADLIDHVASEAGLDKQAAKKAVGAVVDAILAAAKRGEAVPGPCWIALRPDMAG